MNLTNTFVAVILDYRIHGTG